jgi:hypothetical protein
MVEVNVARDMIEALALLVAPKLARAGDDADKLYKKLDAALGDAESAEAVPVSSASIATERLPVMRRALEIMGQDLAGSVALHSNVDMLRWAMDKAWTQAVKYVLCQGAWNFATKRVSLYNGADGETYIPAEGVGGIVEGYSVGPADDDDIEPVSGFDFGYLLPESFLHKIWIKETADGRYEIAHQQLGAYMFTNYDPCVMEYIAYDDYTSDPDNWPTLFLDAVAAYLALSVAPSLVIQQAGKGMRVTPNGLRADLERIWMRKLSDAKIKDAIQQYPKIIPPGRFVQARAGGSRWFR